MVKSTYLPFQFLWLSLSKINLSLDQNFEFSVLLAHTFHTLFLQFRLYFCVKPIYSWAGDCVMVDFCLRKCWAKSLLEHRYLQKILPLPLPNNDQKEWQATTSYIDLIRNILNLDLRNLSNIYLRNLWELNTRNLSNIN